MMRNRLIFTALWMVALSATADPVPEYEMKATYLYNFALYTEWPAGMGDTLNLCVFGEHHFGESLSRLQGKTVNQKQLNIRYVLGYDDVHECQMVFMGEKENRYASRLLAKTGDTPMLTVTEGALSPGSGVMISMALEENKLAFYVNASAARRAGLTVSSKLLRLAKTVY